MNIKGTKKKNQVVTANIFEQQELLKKSEVIKENLAASTWRELETNGKFDKNKKLSFISDDMLILGCDVGSETHYMRAIDTRGRELSKSAHSFNNNQEGFRSAKEWAVRIAAEHDKSQIVLGLEPTGHYWFCLATWMITNGISVVQVNPYAVKQTKEVEDNSQLKDDRKDPKLIANLVKDGNFGMPYLPEKIYAELRRLSMFRDQLNEDRIRTINRMHREMKIYFPEYKEALGKVDGAFSLELLKEAPFPDELTALGEEGIRQIWHAAKLRGRGYSRAREILQYAKASVGIKDGSIASKAAVKWFVQKIMELDVELAVIENQINQKCQEIPHTGNVLEISGIGENTLSGILAEMGDISRFDDVKEIQKLSGLGLVACSSGKHKGETKISHRGRKRLRYWLFQAAKSAVAHAEEFKELHMYYTTRADNPLKKMQSLIVIACKLLRIIYTILNTGTKYAPKKMLMDIRRPENKEAIVA
ncbi:IS110 family RNA-guided transposase [Catonella massiliensis]|uniref:IS110 family transposase n=1 Tax=Catonella massiliensis TaxID=2799636 RepID=A0ABS1J1G4_9FIRM|nr:IS110 family transposase [Catonella massiliensis]MBK5897214.1 IS110 family transposase [Catonella massiliensis]MBK5897454.1 IS110 family transposase [Catonella massiliensis]MBK5898002.1 IS110 family transposase [Catonella massiliensis]MBK5898434.1 IS110 family transposase [Catonella massiliensis]